MLMLLVAMGAVSTLAVFRWQRASDDFQIMNDQRECAETVRTLMFRQISSGLDFLSQVERSDERFYEANRLAHDRLSELRKTLTLDREADYIQALEEVHAELEWMGRRLFRQVSDTTPVVTSNEAHIRLREISDEVTAAVSALNQFYRSEVTRRMQEAIAAGRVAFFVILAAVLLAVAELILMIFLSHRWVVRPIRIVHQTTQTFATGNLDARANITSRDEWGALAASLNGMASSLKQLQQTVRDQERFAALGEIVAYTAHNLRNPLAGIRAAAQVTMQSIPTTETETISSLTDIVQSVDRMDVWMRGLLKLAAPTKLHLETTTVNTLVTEVTQSELPNCRLNNTQLETHLGDQLPEISIDPSLMQQALVALITNARESGAGRIAVRTSAENRAGEPPTVHIGISDNGKGVAPEMMPRLFRAFVTDKPNGTGLGLAQVKKILELHGGKIEIESHPGKGTSVQLTLPGSHGNPA